MSKTFSLAGLRLGWIAAPNELIEQVMIHRDFDTISVGMIDDHFATIALENCNRLLERARRITRGNLEHLSNWISRENKLSWKKPQSGTTALIKLGIDMSPDKYNSKLFNKKFLTEKGLPYPKWL